MFFTREPGLCPRHLSAIQPWFLSSTLSQDIYIQFHHEVYLSEYYVSLGQKMVSGSSNQPELKQSQLFSIFHALLFLKVLIWSFGTNHSVDCHIKEELGFTRITYLS